MNEASNFCTGISCTLPMGSTCPNLEEQTTCCLICNNKNMTQWDDPPYKINSSNVERPLGNKTIAVSATHFGGILEYDAHNLYGFSEAISTNRALKHTLGKRPFVLSRSTFVGSGAYTAHWSGDNGATWNDLAYSIVSILNSGLVGIPMVGADICGFSGDTWEELCNRWIQLGAFYPFSRDHSEKNSRRQELYLWDSVTESAKKVLGLRYRLLPFLYTLAYDAHKTGAPMARPLFFHFNQDPLIYAIDSQFLLGKSILVSPVLTPNTTAISAYFPAGTWYNLFDYSQVINGDIGTYHRLAAPMDTINVHLHEGSILPLQDAALTSSAARKTPFTLIITFGLRKGNENAGYAQGHVFLDDGEDVTMDLKSGNATFIKFQANRNDGLYVVNSIVEEGSFALKKGWQLQRVIILGSTSLPRKLFINGEEAPSTVHLSKSSDVSIEINKLNLLIGQPFTLKCETSNTKA
ncbi:hypothetical protein KP509_08G047500 [Ceratopteris richardii]|nr:hypothetical protein KP509_08G047500 [Ceratopteris richardii]